MKPDNDNLSQVPHDTLRHPVRAPFGNQEQRLTCCCTRRISQNDQQDHICNPGPGTHDQDVPRRKRRIQVDGDSCFLTIVDYRNSLQVAIV